MPTDLVEIRGVASADQLGPTGKREHHGVGDTVGQVSGDLLSLILDHTTDGVLLADARGAIAYANRPLHRLFGYNDGELVGQPLEVLIPEDLRARHRTQVKRFQKNPRPRQMGREDLDIEGRHIDGSSLAVDVQLSALPGVPFVVATVRDMAAQRRSSVDRAIEQLDLATARADVKRLQASLDQVIQRLFALGTSIEAGASDDIELSERLATAVERIDQIIQAVQQGRKPGSDRDR
jgi:PAS domain S-box-containing protein